MTSYQVRVDVFPAVITLNPPPATEEDPMPQAKTYEKARVVLTLDHMFVYLDGQPKPELVFEDSLVSYSPPLPATRVRKASQLLDRSAQFETGEGYTGSFVRMSACGCGSRLKNMSLQDLLPNQEVAQIASTQDAL